MYEEYVSRLTKPAETEAPTEAEPAMMCISDDEEDDCERMESIYSKMLGLSTSEDDYCELQIYLTEKPEARVENKLGMSYNVLNYWKSNSCKFPVLSQLARDVLAIQVSSVASESAFSTSGRVLDPYRSCLTPYIVEVLLCTQQWLRCKYKSEGKIAYVKQMLEESEFLESLGKYNFVFSSGLCF